jgi:uncharacterized protein
MKIFIDIGHPAHVHYFRNFIRLMQERGHEFFVSARNRSIIHYLLDYYSIPFYNRGKGKNGIAGKLFYMFFADYKLLIQALKFKPDIYVSFASPYAAQVAWLTGKPHLALDDTEHAKFGQFFYKPFSTVFLNPYCFKKDFGPKQVKFKSFTELFYLHPKYYSADRDVLSSLNIDKDDRYVLLRFVSWKANHDIGQTGLDLETKRKLLDLLLVHKVKVFVSNESEEIDLQFRPYLLRIKPELIHDVLAFSELIISESGTMTSEAAILGTSVVYVNSLPLMGYLKEELDAGLIYHYKSSDNVLNKVEELLADSELKANGKVKSQALLKSVIDPTSFLIWFVENYPESITVMKKNTDFQEIFRS